MVKDNFSIDYEGILRTDFLQKQQVKYGQKIRIGNETLKLHEINIETTQRSNNPSDN